MTHSSLGLIVVGAGSSRRMGGVDKVWAPLGAHPVIWYALHRLAPLTSATVLVVSAGHATRAADLIRDLPNVTVAVGGAERRHSVLNGLKALPPVDIVAVHDAARPFASTALFARGLACLQPWSAAIPATPVVDTVKEIDKRGCVMSTPNRENLRAVQTPQFFWAAALRQAHNHSARTDSPVTDDAALLEAAGFPVYTFPGEASNFKITSKYDLTLARLIVAQHGAP